MHRAARIAACGHGGQVLVSASTAALVGTDGLRDLGEHRLKDLSAPERIYQLGDGDFPPLKSLHRTNLPIPSTPFLGRERELHEVHELVSRADVRLLTLTGPGGTRQDAARAAGGRRRRRSATPAVSSGCRSLHFATLSSCWRRRGRRSERGTGWPSTSATRAMLLLFDNFEHVIEAAADVAGLLALVPEARPARDQPGAPPRHGRAGVPGALARAARRASTSSWRGHERSSRTSAATAPSRRSAGAWTTCRSRSSWRRRA